MYNKTIQQKLKPSSQTIANQAQKTTNNNKVAKFDKIDDCLVRSSSPIPGSGSGYPKEEEDPSKSGPSQHRADAQRRKSDWIKTRTKGRVLIRVTRLADFSLNGRFFFTLGGLLKLTELAQVFVLFFPTVLDMYLLILTIAGMDYIFGRIFHKLIRSPCC
jgi:hypothetical protein